MPDLRGALGAAIAALTTHPAVAGGHPTALSLVVVWGTGPARVVAHAYAADGAATELETTDALDGAAAEVIAAGGAELVDGEPVGGVVARVTPQEAHVALLPTAATALWSDADAGTLADLARPDLPADAVTVSRASLDDLVTRVLAAPDLEGLLLEAVSVVLRRDAAGTVSWFAFSYPAGHPARLWHPADLHDPATALFVQVDTAEGDTGPRVLVVRLDVNAETAHLALLGGEDTGPWFCPPGAEGALATLAAGITSDEEPHPGPRPDEAAAGSVYDTDGRTRWLRPDAVAGIVTALFDAPHPHPGPVDAAALVALRTGTGVDFAAFVYAELHAVPVVPPGLPLDTLAAAFNENPALTGIVVGSDAAGAHAEVVLLQGDADVAPYRNAAGDPVTFATLVRPWTPPQRAAVQTLRERYGPAAFTPGAGLRIDPLTSGPGWFVAPYAAWSTGRGGGWVVLPDGATGLVAAGEAPDRVADRLRG